MSFPTYPSYQDSGSLVIGSVPTGWRVAELKRLLSRNDGGVWGVDPTGDGDAIVLRSTEQTQDGRWRIDEPALRSLSEVERISSMLDVGDLLITKSSGSSLHIGKTTIVDKDIAAMACCYSNFMQRLRTNNRLIPKFGWYILNSDVARTQFSVLSNSTTGLANLSAGLIGSVLFPVPTIPEQAMIIAFLDRETAKIDALIEEQRRLIALLKEKRQAFILHAVTKGLDPHAVMKGSGIEWLGEVPAHWRIVKIARYFRARKGKEGQLLTKDYCSDNAGDYPVYSGQTENGGIMGTLNRYEFDTSPSGVLFSTTVGAKAMTVSHIAGKFSLSQNCIVIEPDVNSADARFYFYHFQPLFRYHRNMIPEHMQASFRMEDLYSFAIALPSLDEQKSIASQLDQRLASFHDLEATAIASVSLLRERRAAVVSAAVTGKIDVRVSAVVEQELVAA